MLNAIGVEVAPMKAQKGTRAPHAPQTSGGKQATELEELQPGDRFLKYRIQGTLGRGGMGIVYEAVDEYSDDIVAIKHLSVAREDFLRRFRLECRFYPKVHHPNIVRMRDAGVTEDGRAYIIMDRLHGRTLRRILELSRRLDFLNGLHVMLQVAEAMRFVHSKSIWHRDLKPENFMVGMRGEERGHLWVLDFGIARHASGPSTEELPQVGTVRYMSPEQIERQKPDGRADIYAFGAIFYEVLTGRHIFLNDIDDLTPAEIMSGHLFADLPVPVHEVVPDCPEALWPILVKCLEKKRDQRYGSFDEVLEELRALVRASVPPEHVLSKRLRREKLKEHRRAAFDSLHSLPELEADHAREVVERQAKAPGGTFEEAERASGGERKNEASDSFEQKPVDEGGREVQRLTLPLDAYTPPPSALPFIVGAPTPVSQGKGSTEEIPEQAYHQAQSRAVWSAAVAKSMSGSAAATPKGLALLGKTTPLQAVENEGAAEFMVTAPLYPPSSRAAVELSTMDPRPAISDEKAPNAASVTSMPRAAASVANAIVAPNTRRRFRMDWLLPPLIGLVLTLAGLIVVLTIRADRRSGVSRSDVATTAPSAPTSVDPSVTASAEAIVASAKAAVPSMMEPSATAVASTKLPEPSAAPAADPRSAASAVPVASTAPRSTAKPAASTPAATPAKPSGRFLSRVNGTGTPRGEAKPAEPPKLIFEFKDEPKSQGKR